jgi:hypothetical protein
MEPECSLLCSQESYTGLYAEPDQYSTSHPMSVNSVLKLCPTYVLYDLVVSCRRGVAPGS